jgi:hypothetical protein
LCGPTRSFDGSPPRSDFKSGAAAGISVLLERGRR